jgi:hypothetical protein
MNANSTRYVIVESGGTQVVGHAGLHALGMFADRLGVGEALSRAVGWNGPGVPVHDRGKVLTQAMLMLAGGGEACTDIEMLASSERLFSDVCSDTTLYRTFTDTLNPDTVARSRDAMAKVRSEVWSRLGVVTGDGPVMLDLDASLVETHSDNKQGAAPHFKGGYGFHPLFCFADATGEALAGELRPGNATANDVADLLRVLDDDVSQLPTEVQAGPTTKATILLRRNAQWWYVLILREEPKHSSIDYGHATSGSTSLPAAKPLYRQQSRPQTRTRIGGRRRLGVLI